MKTFTIMLLAVAVTMCAGAEMRTWTVKGKTLEAEYVRLLFDDVILRNASEEEIRVPMDAISSEDTKYVELRNPPQLSIDIMKSEDQEFIPYSPFPTGGAIPDPPVLLVFQFGARVKQKDVKSYGHPLKLEVYNFTQQRYDPDKYHLISKDVSEPFVLSGENDYRHEYTARKKYNVYRYDIYVDYLSWREPRGEKHAETLVLIRDERGEIIAYNTTKNWLYENLDKLEELPVGAWLDKTCTRVHPTPPKVTKKPGTRWL